MVVTVGPPNVCTLTGTVVRFVGVGTCTCGIAANQSGNTSYEAAAQVTQSVNVDYRYTGFLDPVKNNGVLNVAKAGQVIPVKWRLTDGSGAPVTTLNDAPAADSSVSQVPMARHHLDLGPHPRLDAALIQVSADAEVPEHEDRSGAISADGGLGSAREFRAGEERGR